MAPDVAKTTPKLCKKYNYTGHQKYSQWEKERRARFNDKLEELSRALPGYNKDNPWKKIEIVEQAIANIHARKLAVSKAHDEAVCKLSKEVQALKSVIMKFTNFGQSSEDILKMPSSDIEQVLEEVRVRDKENQAPETQQIGHTETEESLAFVAKIARSNDHSYSLSTVETPSLEVDSEEVVETVVVEQEEDVQEVQPLPQPIFVNLEAEFEPSQQHPVPSYVSFDPSPLPSSLSLVPQIISLQQLPWARKATAAPNVTTIFVNKGSRASLLSTAETLAVGPAKLPIPRLKPAKRTPRPKRARSGVVKKKAKKAVEEQKVVEEGAGFEAPAAQKEAEGASVNESLEDLEAVNGALPIDKEVIDLQNNEEMEILEETIKEQGERETREKSENDAKKKDGKESQTPVENKTVELVVVHKKKVDTGKKKSKSSYSIAALCQISVNIGDRPEMANSPGVLSLNSVGTMSPSHTPAPTPTPDPIKTFGMETIVIDREDNVLEELRTIRPEDVSFETQGVSSGGQSDLKKIVSPSQSFLTHFPAVSKGDQEDTTSVSTKTIQRDIYQALKDLDKELNLETEGLTPTGQAVVTKLSDSKKPLDVVTKDSKASLAAVTVTVSTATVSRYLPCTAPPVPPSTSAALSVYDFSASKPDTPPIPLQKTRKQEVRREEPRPAVPYKSPEKKTYTEMQSKPKKSPVDSGKVGKEGGGQGLQQGSYPQPMEYQQQAKAGSHYHQPPGSYQPRHNMYMAPHYSTVPVPYQSVQQHYQHYPSEEMKPQPSHHSRYSCSSHYLAPNYQHYPTGPKHYQSQAWGPHNTPQSYPKARDRGVQPHMEMDAPSSAPIQGPATTFTVNQLVNSSQRKGGTKRSSVQAKVGPAKVPRGEVAKEKEKEDCRKRSGGSKRNKSGGRSTSYSAESLMLPSSAGLVVTAETKEEGKLKLGPSPVKKESKVEASMAGSRAQANSWANADHFGGLQFSSLSPSPASLFPPDLSSLDFPMTMFGAEGKDYSLPPPSSSSQSSQKTPGKQQQAACQRAVSSVADWSLNSTILDSGFLPPLPTLTPPGDPMGDPMASYNFMSPMPHTHTGFYSCSAPQASGRVQGQSHSYSAHSAANIPISGYSSSSMVMTKPGTSQPFPPSQVGVIKSRCHSDTICKFSNPTVSVQYI